MNAGGEGEKEVLTGLLAHSSLREFVTAAELYGARGITFEKLPDGTEVLSQKLGEGWHGLGWDGKNLWLGLTPAGERFDWNANTILRSGETYRGIIPGKEGQIAVDHPVRQLSKHIANINHVLHHDRGMNLPDIELHVTGFHARWELNESTRLTYDRMGNSIGSIPTGSEIKAVINNVGQIGTIKFEDAKWVPGAVQRLSIKRNPLPLRLPPAA